MWHWSIRQLIWKNENLKSYKIGIKTQTMAVIVEKAKSHTGNELGGF